MTVPQNPISFSFQPGAKGTIPIFLSITDTIHSIKAHTNLSNAKGKRRSAKFLHPTTRAEAGKHKNKITQSRGKIDDLWRGKVRSDPGALSTIPCCRLLQPSVLMAIGLLFTSATPEPSGLPLPFACIQPMSSQENICPQFGTHCPVSL